MADAAQTESNRFPDSKATKEKTETEEANRLQPKTELESALRLTCARVQA